MGRGSRRPPKLRKSASFELPPSEQQGFRFTVRVANLAVTGGGAASGPKHHAGDSVSLSKKVQVSRLSSCS